ncbi:MAG: hypothetical protein JST19_17385 [Bacteroidetes bacterium]|nr:hypothetical protein [Bacteroidota bacterium]
MKRFKINLTAAAFALGIGLAVITSLSSFSKATVKAGNTIYYYTLDQGSGDYLSAGTTEPDPSGCGGTASYKCVIGFSSDEGPSLNPASLPATPVWTSPSDAYYAN